MKTIIAILFLLVCLLGHSQIETKPKEEVKPSSYDSLPNVVVDTIGISNFNKFYSENKTFNKSTIELDKSLEQDVINLSKQIDSFKQEENVQSQEKQQELEEKTELLQEAQFQQLDNLSQNNNIKGRKASVSVSVESNIRGLEDNFLDPKRLHGPSQFDSRIEIRQLLPSIDWQFQILNRNQSVAIVVEKEKLTKISNAFYQLDISSTAGKMYGLCEDVPFRYQPVVGVGTAFIVGQNEMLTAKHVFQRPLENYVIVFGFDLINKEGIVDTIIKADDVYQPTQVVFASDEYDITIFKLDRQSTRPILEWESSKSLPKDTEVYMLGHPSGLPKKVAVNASITENSNNYYFFTSLDSFQGNSGSPVFNFETHKVIGVTVSGELDYQFNGTCNEINSCQIPYCKGEKVMRIENLIPNKN